MILQKQRFWVNAMAQQLKVLSVTPEDLSSTPEIHAVEED